MAKIGKVFGIVVLIVVFLIAAVIFLLPRFIDPNDYKDQISALVKEKANIVLRLDGPIDWRFFPRFGLTLRQASVSGVETPDTPLAKVDTISLTIRILPLFRKEIHVREIMIDGLTLTPKRYADGSTNWQNIGVSGDTLSFDDAPTSQNESASLGIDIERIEIRNAYFDGGEIGWRGKFSLETTLTTSFVAQQYVFDALRIHGEVSNMAMDNKILPFSVTGKIKIDQAAQDLTWLPLNIDVGTLKAEGDILLRDWNTIPVYHGKLSITQSDLRKWMEELAISLPATENPSALTRFSLNTDISGVAKAIRFDNFTTTLDKTTLEGSIVLEIGEKPLIAVDLSGDRIDIDHYLPSKKSSDQKANEKEFPEDIWSDKPILPLEFFRSIDFSLNAKLDQLTVVKVPIEKLEIKVENKDGVVRLSSFHGALFNGTVSADAVLDVRSETPKIFVRRAVDGIQLDELIKAIRNDNQSAAPIKGKIKSGSASFQTSGNSLKEWVNALNGDADFSIDDGVLPDANLEMKLCTAIALLNRKPLTKEYDIRDTAFRRMSGSLHIRNGVAHNPDLTISLPGLNIKGRGDIDIRDLILDYRVGIIIEGDQTAMPDPACVVNPRYVGIEIPLICHGTLLSGAKTCGIDKESIADIAFKLVGDKLSDKAFDKIEDKLNGKVSPELREAVKRLLKR
ncbi:MAG: AsmA family protein [Burkholderiales bacterium]|nr:AsmA family protein [Burkholderiales bacterium]